MRRRLVLALMSVAAVMLLVFGIPLASFVAKVERERLITALERDAFILAGHAKETLNTSAGSVLPSLQPYIAEQRAVNGARVLVTNAMGLVVASNDPTLEIGANFSSRPEIETALTGMPAVGERSSRTLGQRLVFVAVPVLLGDEVLGVVRFSSPQSRIDKEVRDRVVGIVLAGTLTMLAAGTLAIPFALGIARPITRLTRRTEKLADGDFSVRADDSSGPPELRELSRSFNVMAGRLGLMVENQKNFAGAVSHQLRTPLTALRLRLEQAQSALGDNAPQVADAIEASRAEMDRLQEMVEQLLALARIEGGTAATATVDASAIARSRIEMWESLAGERNISFTVTAPIHASCAAIDGALEQIIDNYIDNALGVAPDNSVIAVVITHDSSHITLDVIDEGPGLTDEQCVRAFERFWRGQHTENAPGTGLGLAIVRQLAVASGGTTELLQRGDGQQGLVARVTLTAR
jgi:signal transduction histidine kinase